MTIILVKNVLLDLKIINKKETLLKIRHKHKHHKAITIYNVIYTIFVNALLQMITTQ